MKIVRPALFGIIVFCSTCGLTHLAEMSSIWWPAYRFITTIHVINAITSSIGVYLTIKAILVIRFIPVRSDLEDELDILRNNLKDIQEQANVIAATTGVASAIKKLRMASAALQSLKSITI